VQLSDQQIRKAKPQVKETKLFDGNGLYGGACNRTAHLAERRERRKMMQTWADYLDGLVVGAKVIPLKRSGGE